jgi:1-acyl-sn-glycerol-3-phosphate acyltransferase
MTSTSPGEQPTTPATSGATATAPEAPGPEPGAAPGTPGTDGEAASHARARRLPPSRLSPEALAAQRADGALEGLAWLGRQPEAKASLSYRLLRLVARALLFGAFRFHISTSGQELLPRGGYLLIAAAHRGWMDPFVAMHAIPEQPRAWFLGSAPSTFTSRWRERLIHRIGGLLPVWRGGLGVEPHVASARAVVRNGAVFVQMPEGTVSGPPGRIGPFRHGAALIAIRTRAPIVPLAMAGTEDLYVGRRMASRVLPLTSAEALAGDVWPVAPLEEGSREELELARLVTRRLEALIGPVVEELYPGTVDPPSHPRRLRNRLTWLLLRPGRLDRTDT